MKWTFIMMLLIACQAEAQVYVPQECAQLALREGFPADEMTKVQAAKAKIRLLKLKDSDPIVRDCRAAVARAKAGLARP